MQSILDRLAVEDTGLPDPTTLEPETGRLQAAQANRRWNEEADLPGGVSVERLTITGGDGQPMACRLYRPLDAGPEGAVLHIHGGGWAFCDLETHERASRVLALACRVPVLSCTYRQAPEYPFPSGLDDCRAAWTALAGGFQGLKGPFAIAGDSAGANLAIAVMLAQAARGETIPDAGLLFYGVYGVNFDTQSYLAHAEGPGLTRAKMMRYWNWYAGPELRDDPLAVPLAAGDEQLAGLPPLYISAAAVDVLRSDSEALFARLKALGRADRYRLHDGVVHGFMQMSNELEEARLAFAHAGEAFRALCRPGTANHRKKEDA
jgi:acetyl esterase